MFWVYGFPLLMVVALGIAFRANPVEKVTVDVQAGPQAEKVRDALIRQSTARGLTFDVQIDDEETSRRRLRTGKTDLVVLVSPGRQLPVPPRPQPRGKPSRADGRARRAAARGGPDRSGADTGRPGDDRAREPLHRLPGARPARHEPDGRRTVGRRLRDRRHADPQAAQALRGDADAPQRLPARHHDQPAGLHDPGSASCSWSSRGSSSASSSPAARAPCWC